MDVCFDEGGWEYASVVFVCIVSSVQCTPDDKLSRG